MTLLELLQQIQSDEKLSDRQFADRLGVSHVLWLYVRQGKRPIRFELLSGAIAAFPENEVLKSAVVDFLGESGLAAQAAEASEATA
jgi:transcriptional regulator with XRE-family HTH domain